MSHDCHLTAHIKVILYRCDFYYLFEEENPIGPPPKELAAKGIETGPKKKKKSYDPEPRRVSR